jgi:hypothetical protein
MGLDLRWPIGLMFSLIGVLLTGYGALTASDAEMYKRSLGVNINLCWGVVLLIFGALMLVLAWRGKTQADTSAPTDQK